MSGVDVKLGLRRRSVYWDGCGIEPVVVQAVRVVDDLKFHKPVKTDAGIRAGYVNHPCGVKVGDIRTGWILPVVLGRIG